MEEPASAEASITFCPFRADKRPAEGFGMVGLQRFAFVLPHAARNRQGFGELPPKNARVRADARVLLVTLGRKRFQRAEICRFLLCYQDILVITKHSNACCEPWTRTRAFFGGK